jgi:hypothetical protein
VGRKAARWRRWNRAIHRDLGYVCVGLTLVYGASGVAVNHVRDWNPNYRVTVDSFPVPHASRSAGTDGGFPEAVLASVGLEGPVRGTFRPDSATLEVFLPEHTVRVDLDGKVATVERIEERRLLRRANLLHLNEPRGLWTYVADAFALSLVLLAATGLFMMKGKHGITGRGAWLTGLGILLPVAILLVLGS